MQPTVYHLDDALRITQVNEAWSAFALANGAPHLAGTACLGQSLLDYISDPTTATLYGMLFDQARNTGQVVEVPFRCDAPDLRRFMQLRIEAEPGGFQLVAKLLRVEAREPVSQLAAKPSANARVPTIYMCGWCKTVQVGALWCEVEDAVRELGLFERDAALGVSHGICPSCLAQVEDLVTLGPNPSSSDQEPPQ